MDAKKQGQEAVQEKSGKSWLLEIWMYKMLRELGRVLIIKLAIRNWAKEAARAARSPVIAPPGRGQSQNGNS